MVSFLSFVSNQLSLQSIFFKVITGIQIWILKASALNTHKIYVKQTIGKKSFIRVLQVCHYCSDILRKTNTTEIETNRALVEQIQMANFLFIGAAKYSPNLNYRPGLDSNGKNVPGCQMVWTLNFVQNLNILASKQPKTGILVCILEDIIIRTSQS